MISRRKLKKLGEKTAAVLLPTTNLAFIHLGLNPNLNHEKAVPNDLSYGMNKPLKLILTMDRVE
jgi:hypothetical protein